MTSRAADPADPQQVAGGLIDAIARTCPAYRPGTRPIHAPGVAATGWFSATPVAPTYTAAQHFSGDRIPVTVRFSNGTGDLNVPDAVPQVRGMAVKFHLGPVTTDEWGVLHSEAETDLVAMTLPMFFSRTVSEFQQFLAAAVPAIPKSRSWLRKLIEQARRETPYPSPAPGRPSDEQGVFDFARTHPEVCPTLVYLGGKFVPEAYTTCSYHAVHAFALTAADGIERFVRFHWEPVEGVKAAGAGATGNFLREGLADRIVDGRAEFVLRIQLAEPGDDLTDPTRIWPSRRPRIVMGHLRLTDIAADQFHGCELLSFNPVPDLPGIAPSADPTLQVRGDVYPLSAARRRREALDLANTRAPLTSSRG